jgi:hypothetical protein
MNWLLLWVYLLALATWLGETVFFTAVVAPALFGGLGSEQGGAAVALIFPGYYAVGYVCGALLVLTAIALRQRSRPAGQPWLAAAAVAAVILAACLFAGLVVLPQADALRPQLHDPAAGASVRQQFDALHRRAVELNAAVLVGNLALAGFLAARLRAGIGPGRRLSRYATDPLP